MRLSHYFIPALKETPADTELASHRLMLRAGLLHKLASGLYTWLPLGLRVLRKVESIVREEMNAIGALELLMPSIQPAELWQETERWEAFGSLLLKIYDRHKRAFCYGPTHEEVITDMLRYCLRSYKQLPITFYQLQTKFRDEVRPRFGVMRAREFLMKDAYSFHLDDASLEKTYRDMYDAYSRIFTRLGLEFRAVQADTGSIGGNVSHEFQVLASSGEDCIVYSEGEDAPAYVANREVATAHIPTGDFPSPSGEPMTVVDTPGLYTIDALCKAFDMPIEKTVKTLMVDGVEGDLVALILRGDHTLNPLQAEKLPEVAKPLRLADPDKIRAVLNCSPGSLGPVELPLTVVADHDALYIADFSCGVNQDDKHYINVNWGRDLPVPKRASLRLVEEGDPSPSGKGVLRLTRGIEVGHIFQLGKKYTQAMGANVLNLQGKPVAPSMGCYGIGLSRIVAAAIEQHHDDNGIIWPAALAPFHVVILPISQAKSYRAKTLAEKLYKDLQEAGVEVLLDDTNDRPGVQFARADLIGIPHRVVISEKHIDNRVVEYKHRGDAQSKLLAYDEVVKLLKGLLHIATPAS